MDLINGEWEKYALHAKSHFCLRERDNKRSTERVVHSLQVTASLFTSLTLGVLMMKETV